MELHFSPNPITFPLTLFHFFPFAFHKLTDYSLCLYNSSLLEAETIVILKSKWINLKQPMVSLKQSFLDLKVVTLRLFWRFSYLSALIIFEKQSLSC